MTENYVRSLYWALIFNIQNRLNRIVTKVAEEFIRHYGSQNINLHSCLLLEHNRRHLHPIQNHAFFKINFKLNYICKM
jgi:hypothetical protein